MYLHIKNVFQKILYLKAYKESEINSAYSYDYI